jgi:spermidine synthase
MTWFSIFFFLSGLCSIVYELVWLRLAMAKFGVTTALISIVLSVFMAGLGAGSWIAGVLMRRYGDRMRISPLRLYGVIELAIGVSALAVPLELVWGSRLLERVAGGSSVSSGSYYVLSGTWLAITLIPWCACMGATIPVAMFAIRKLAPGESERSFSLLYLANVIGAVGGACLALVLIELYGFHGTLRVAAVINVVICAAAMVLAVRTRGQAASTAALASPTHSKTANEWGTRSLDGEGEWVTSGVNPAANVTRDNSALLLLFTTGLATMAAEVVWIRLYTAYIGPVVYSFALILATYLTATFIGSKIYRMWSRRARAEESRLLWVSLSFFGLLPLITADPRFLPAHHDLRVVLGIAPFAGIIGFLTPMLVDRWSGGDPDRAGRAYAVNVIGCIIGPLLAGFLLLPLLGEHLSMFVLVVPWLGMALFSRIEKMALQAATAAIIIAAITVLFFTRGYEGQYSEGVMLRDSTATVIAAGEGMEKRLIVNGVGMTSLTPITKMMAHFTFTHLPGPPRNALIICFGMGTTFRSAMSWGIPVTVAELVPSVPKLFTYYHPDGGPLLESPRAHIVIDDGRRFLDRSAKKFDAVIIDPPPPIDSAGSSLLYTREFYRLIRDHLSPGGILQQWFFGGDAVDKAAAIRAMTDVFPYVRVFRSRMMDDGMHILASMHPIPRRDPAELLVRMPGPAVIDMMEWGPGKTPEEQLEIVLSGELPPRGLIARSPHTPALDDDRPINEYHRIRDMFASAGPTGGTTNAASSAP